MKKQVTLTLTGFTITGEATLEMWGGGQGTIQIRETFLEKELFSKDNILRCVNDNGFGCQGISKADIYVYRVYSTGYREYDRTISTSSKHHTKLFLGWRSLDEQRAKLVKEV